MVNFKKCDFHLHSGSDESRSFSNDDFKQAIISSSLDVISITDHNLFNEALFLECSELENINNNKIIIYPGVELDLHFTKSDEEKYRIQLNENSFFHAIVIFNPTEYEKINPKLEQLFSLVQKTNDYKKYSLELKDKYPRGVPVSTFLDVFEECEYYFIPHVNKSARNITQCFSGDTEDVIKRNKNFYSKFLLNYNVGLDGLVESSMGKNNKNRALVEKIDDEFDLETPYFLFSDCKKPEEIGSKFTWINYNGKFEDLVLPFTSRKTRIFTSSQTKETPQKNSNNYFNKVTFKSDIDTQKVNLELSPGLNCIIGARGSGKSTLANFIKSGLDVNYDNIKFTNRELLKNGVLESNPNVLHINQGYFEKMFLDTRNIDLGKLDYFSQIKENIINSHKENDDNSIIDITNNSNNLTSSFLEYHKKYENKTLHFIEDFATDQNAFTKYEYDSSQIENINGIENKLTDINKNLHTSINDILSQSIKLEFVEDNDLECDRLCAIYKMRLSSFILESVKIDKSKKALAGKRRSNIGKFNDAILDNNRSNNSYNTQNNNNYENELNFLIDLHNLRKEITVFVKLVDNRILEMKREASDVKKFELSDNTEIKFISTAGLNLEFDPIEKFLRAKQQGDVISFFDMLLFSDSKELNKIFKGFNGISNSKIVIKFINGVIACIKESLKYNIEIFQNEKSFNHLSPGMRAEALLKLIFEIEMRDSNYDLIIFDQPEDNLDKKTIHKILIEQIRKYKLEKQIIIISHSAQVVINGDADNVILCKTINERFHALSGTLTDRGIRKDTVEFLDGGRKFMVERFNKYNFKVEENE